NSIVCSCNVRVNVISLLFTNTTHFRSWACFLQGIGEVCQRNPANGSIVHNKVSQENALDRRRLLLPFRRPGIPNCRCDGCPVASPAQTGEPSALHRLVQPCATSRNNDVMAP